MATTRFSRQREALLDTLRARYDHPTAETLYHSLRESQPNISLGTVYRNLSLLEGQGTVRRLQGPNGPDHYDGDITPHNHLHCRSCGAVVDLMGLEGAVDLPGAREAAKRCGMVVESHQVSFYGLCDVCATKDATQVH